MSKQAPIKKSNSTPKERGNTRSSREDEQDIRDARRALRESQKKGSIPWEKVKREVGI